MAFDIQKIREKLKEVQAKSSGGGYIKFKEGPNNLRILEDAKQDWFLESGQHVIQVGKEKLYIACNQMTDGSTCGFCGVVEEMFKSKDPSDKETAKAWKAKIKIYYHILDRDDGNKFKKMTSGNMIFLDILKYAGHDDWGNLFDAKTGYDVVVTKTSGAKGIGGPMDVQYDAIARKNSSPVGVDLDTLDIPALGSDIVLYTPDEHMKLLDGMTEEEVIKQRASRTASQSRVVKEPDKEVQTQGKGSVEDEIASALEEMKTKFKK